MGHNTRQYDRERTRRNRNPFWAGGRFRYVLLWILTALNMILMIRLSGRVRELNRQISGFRSRLSVMAQDQAVVTDREDTGEQTAAQEREKVSGYAEQWGLEEVDPPRERSFREILERLEKLGEGNELIAGVAENYRAYPQQLLEALSNNPELADFASNYLSRKGTVTGEGLTKEEKEQDYPLFLQWDPRWGYASYGDDSVVGLSGCGPTALSMVLYYLTGDEGVLPDVLAKYSMDEGYYISGTGTAWLLFEDVPPRYGVTVEQPEKNEQTMKQALDQGSLIICSMGPGDFTIGGHFVVVYGYTEEGFLLNDPNCVARSRTVWPYSQIGGQIKHIWIFQA